ncbi:MAG TPA: endonuclease/exonuclease/phosphatase family protein [Aliiroseovarius sp.]|nr:endonuclease/exonuclease/phosphatase family protein [Aliiroseovarius sp.]
MAYPVFGDSVRVATFNTDLARKGPGLLLRDILSGDDEQVIAVADVVARTAPDILLLLDFDYDLNGHALQAFRDRVAERGGPEYPHLFAFRPNTGLATGLDMDGNGRLGEARDAQGYGRFNGQGGMAILSRFPILTDQARDFSGFLWRDLPGAIPPVVNDQPFPSPQAQAIQRLSSVGHWDVPVRLPNGAALHLLAFHATTPVYDGPEDRNGRRNHDEIMFWPLLLDGALPFPPPARPFVIMGDANLDANAGQGRRSAIRALLAYPAIQDPAPASEGARKAGDATDTVDWPEPRPGNLRVDYVLPSADLKVVGSGVYWPAPDQDGASIAEKASRHRLVWVDLDY